MQKEKTREELILELEELQQHFVDLRSRYELEIQEQRQLELNYRQREAWFRAMFENTGDGVIIVSLDGVILEFNSAFAVMHGYVPDEMPVKNVADFDTPDKHSEFRERVLKLVEGEPQVFEAEHYHKEGHVLTMEITASLITIASQQFVTGSHRDITKRKQAEQLLKKSEAKYKRLHETMRDCFVETNMDGKIVEANKSYRDMLGYTEEELYNLTYNEVTPEKWHNMENEIIEKQIIPRGYSEIYQKEYRRKDGSVFPVELRTLLLKDENDVPTGMWAIVRDISERVATIDALRESEERYRMLFEMESDAIFLIDNETGQILEVNAAATDMYGFSRSELLTMKNSDLSAEPEETQRITRGGMTISGDRIYIPLRLHRKKDGSIFFIEISGYFFLHRGRQVHIAAIRDITARKNAEDELRLSQETYRGLVDSVEEAIYVQDRDGTFLEVNKAAERMYGYPADYFIGRTPEFLSAPGKNDLNVLMDALKLAYDGTPQLMLFWGLRKNGTIFPKEISISPGNYFGQRAIVVVARDISERKQSELLIREKNQALLEANEALFKINDKLEKSEKLLKESQKIAGLGSYMLDFRSGLWTSSEVLDSIFGFVPSDNNTIKDWEELVHPDWREEVFDYFNKDVIGNHHRFDKVYKIVRRTDSKEMWVHGIGELTYDNNGQLAYMTGSIQDISERKESEQALLEIQTNLTALIESSTDIIWVLDRNFCLILCNTKFFSYIKATIHLDLKIGDSVDNPAFPESFRDQWRSYYMRAFNGEVFTFEQESVLARTQGFFEFSLYAIKGGDGMPRAVVVSARDVSERRRLESQVIQTDRLSSLGEMATGIAHEINQPLNNISMTVDNILYDIHEKHSVDVNYVEGKAQKLFANIDRMRNLIDHIRLFARSHEDPLNNTFQVNEGINNALSMIGAQLRHLDIEIDIVLAADLPIVEGSVYKFEQVILNLMLNAKDGLEEKRLAGDQIFPKVIKVSSRLNDDEIVIEVEDNGAGIDEDKLPQIFVPFFSTKDEGKGTGLGLSISFGIIKQLNGRIDILSKKHTFTKAVICLPIHGSLNKNNVNNN